MDYFSTITLQNYFSMNLVITDSGLGGLSVFAQLMRFLKDRASSGNSANLVDNLNITYVNAVPSNERGYNSMSGSTEQIETFDKILNNTKKLFMPDYIFVACGSLSVLLKELQFQSNAELKIDGILSIGNKQLLGSLNQNSKTTALIFATPTTIRAKTIQHELYKNGIAEKRIITQACPELATQISNDPEGSKVAESIRHWVRQALQKLTADSNSPLIAYLGCTHYSYRESLFQDAFIQEGFSNITLLNPNLAAAEYLYKIVLQNQDSATILSKDISLSFSTPYPIPEQEIKTLSKLLNPISVETAEAFQNAIICPELLAD
ncbi:MAG: aspartate/glutamate racemase family protein [SAR324 cluster bacterium]|nr:aspartate/glutamate racemase family protein [SAR324 cluster bacterium]